MVKRFAAFVGVTSILAVAVVASGAIGAQNGDAATAGRATLIVKVRLGDICPHDTVPPSPDCAPQPLAGAEVRLLNASGLAVAKGRSNENGKAVLYARAGHYLLVARPVQGAQITPTPRSVTLTTTAPRTVVVTYATGIQ